MTNFIVGFAFGFGLYFIVRGLSSLFNKMLRVKKDNNLKWSKILSEHSAAMQALRILRGKIYVSTSAGKEHVISDYEKKVIEDALNGKYTIIGL